MRCCLLAVVLCALGACAGSPEAGRDMALTCATTACECVTPKVSPFGKSDPGPVLWRENGDAYCPEGQVLQRANYKRKFLEKYGG